MNTQELLEQFILEARECLETIGQRLLQVERSPDDTELLNDLFRLVHTLKGNCGLFEFKALERIVHAGEDVLDRIRNGDMAYSPAIGDTLLDAMDYTVELIDTIEQHGALPNTPDERASALAQALRAHLQPAAVSSAAQPVPVQTPAMAQARPADTVPDVLPIPPSWLADLPADLVAQAQVAVCYQPEPGCFFKGEDPWQLVQHTPGLLHLQVSALKPWPDAAAFDCYDCNLEVLLLSQATVAEVEHHFRYIPEQVELYGPALSQSLATSGAVPVMPTPAPCTSPAPVQAASTRAAPVAASAQHVLATYRVEGEAVAQRLHALWEQQIRLLQRVGQDSGKLAGIAQTLHNLLKCRPSAHTPALERSLTQVSTAPAALLQWAQQHRPVALDPGSDQPAESTADTLSASSTAATAAHSRASAAGSATPTTAAAGATPRGMATAGNGSGEDSPHERGNKVLKVAQDKIDRLMELIGEMVVAKNALPYLAIRAETVFQQRELAREIKTQYSVINRIAEDMQHAIMQVRMLPVGTIFQRFGRLVRDLSKKLGKDVQLVVEGEETEADKNVIESLADPLIHILRNSLDHGFETPEVRRAAGKPAQGTLRVSAHQESDRVIITISDDGAGIDPVRVRNKAIERGLIPADRADSLSDHDTAQLVFLPGFSTAATISDLSGRGVGMDVVRTAVERISGQVELSSTLGQGTTVQLTLPLSMAVTNVMMIEAGGSRFGIPMDLIVETVRVPIDDIHHFKQSQTTVLRGRIVPLQSLAGLLGMSTPPRPNDDAELAVLVIRFGNENIGLLVDDFHGTSDIILKPLEGVLAGLTGFAGTALMGDGSVLMILNPKELV